MCGSELACIRVSERNVCGSELACMIVSECNVCGSGLACMIVSEPFEQTIAEIKIEKQCKHQSAHHTIQCAQVETI